MKYILIVVTIGVALRLYNTMPQSCGEYTILKGGQYVSMEITEELSKAFEEDAMVSAQECIDAG